MLFTKSTVGEKVFQKIKKKSLDYIIIETYMGALPFDEEFTDKRKHEVAHFAYNVLESINVSDMLDKAITVLEMSEGRRDRRDNRSFKDLFEEINREANAAVRTNEPAWKEAYEKALADVVAEQNKAAGKDA